MSNCFYEITSSESSILVWNYLVALKISIKGDKQNGWQTSSICFTLQEGTVYFEQYLHLSRNFDNFKLIKTNYIDLFLFPFVCLQFNCGRTLAIMKFSLALCFVICGSLVLMTDAEVRISVMSEFFMVTKFALPFVTFYKDINRENHSLTVFLMDDDNALRCYSCKDLGLLCAVMSQVDLFGNTLQVFQDDNCNGRSTKLSPTTKKPCLDFFVNCDQDGGNWNDNIRSFRVCKV